MPVVWFPTEQNWISGISAHLARVVAWTKGVGTWGYVH